MQFQRQVLSNGLRLLTIPMPSFESATVMVLVGAGSRYETEHNNGASHFLEHMAFKGTKKRPSAMDISSLIDGIGGEFNAFTGKETTGYYIKSASDKIEICLDVLSDMLQNSLFKPEEIEKEKGVIIEEINLYEDTPARKIGDIYESLLYGDTPMGWDIGGRKDVIKSTMREDFTSYMESLYSAGNMTVIIAGGVDTKKTSELVEKYFGEMKQFDTKKFVEVVEKQNKPEILIKQKNTEQVHIALGVRTVPVNNDEKYPLGILAGILGSGMSSRLFHEVREKRGLGYYIRTSSDHNQDCGTLVSTAGIDPKRVDEAISVIVAEYHRIRTEKNGITTKEISKAKEYLKGHLVLELEDSRAVAGFYGTQEILEDKVENPTDYLAKIDKISTEEVFEVAKKYLIASTLNLAVIGNFDPSTSSGHSADGQRFEKLLKLT
ncbi:MAG: pitrilysin family protein [Patescibacteria group bacterium]